MAPHNRSNDGITLNKITITITGAAITIAMGLGSYEYNKNLDYQSKNLDRVELRQNELHADIKNLVTGINDLVVQQKITYAQQVNMDARLVRNENEIKAMRHDINGWAKDLRQYK